MVNSITRLLRMGTVKQEFRRSADQVQLCLFFSRSLSLTPSRASRYGPMNITYHPLISRKPHKIVDFETSNSRLEIGVRGRRRYDARAFYHIG